MSSISYAAADLYVSPSEEDSFGMPVAEHALVCGHHLDFSGYPLFSTMEWIGLILRDPRDAKTLATMIRRALPGGRMAQPHGQAATKHLGKWTWDRNALTSGAYSTSGRQKTSRAVQP